MKVSRRRHTNLFKWSAACLRILA